MSNKNEPRTGLKLVHSANIAPERGLLINLDEVRLAKKIVREIPGALIALDKCYQLVYSYGNYTDIAAVINEMIEARIMLELYLEVYTRFLQENGVK